MSRPGNSEVYVVCIEFVGIRSSLLSVLSNLVDSSLSLFGGPSHEAKKQYALIPRQWIPQAFVEECVEAASLFTNLQIQQIERNLNLFQSEALDHRMLHKISQRQREKAMDFIRRSHIEYRHGSFIFYLSLIYLYFNLSSIYLPGSLPISIFLCLSIDRRLPAYICAHSALSSLVSSYAFTYTYIHTYTSIRTYMYLCTYTHVYHSYLLYMDS
ncbi:ribosomal rna large subunit methyltransferase j protein [Cystoisospora suis]|uniref:Ribosomal rna large subunit methyltransferase j protein n=1 Tax=Cystoisospora suis TaxID=483139 RepID=A0A2C6L1I7_9APIC|nr:ribosomal rna large subunit methyltransferase j protein [Cystoisospora suis]